MEYFDGERRDERGDGERGLIELQRGEGKSVDRERGYLEKKGYIEIDN